MLLQVVTHIWTAKLLTPGKLLKGEEKNQKWRRGRVHSGSYKRAISSKTYTISTTESHTY
jgi:hypothetical protein